MSSSNFFLSLRLEGPLQSWGFDSQYSRRNTGLMPTKSGVAGMCCAALGYPRGSGLEHKFLSKFNAIKMTVIAIPRNVKNEFLPVRRLQDYHTVQNTKTADGKIKDCHITYRQYLSDAAFGVILEGDPALLGEIAAALVNPRWGIWLGRKTCIPSAPIFAGLKKNQDEAIGILIGEKPLEAFTRQEEVDFFADGSDSLPDTPLTFDIENRAFAPRRVKIWHGI